MRRAMADAIVGDDVYGEDPTTLELESEIATLLEKPAALFVSSGTMANQLAIALQTRPGDEVIVGEHAHPMLYESGAAAALSGVQFAVAGSGGLFTADQAKAAIKPGAYYYPRTAMISVENTHNRSGGRVFPHADLQAIAALASEHGLAAHLDGARLFNAACATRRPLAGLAKGYNTVSVCFSKGLGAPVGSALLGSRDQMIAARRLRKMWGGGMRQVGILAAGALYALRHNRTRLADDHEHARRLAEGLQAVANVTTPQTNIVVIETQQDAAILVEQAKAAGLLASAMGVRTLRLVTHLDVTSTDITEAIEVLKRVFVP
jgi:threonine aldolase